jgi:molecular chaperone GrpE
MSEENKDIDMKKQSIDDTSKVEETKPDEECLDNNAQESPLDEDQLSALIKENTRLNDLLLRGKAELDNFQKRTIKQMQQAQLYSTEKLASELMVIIDSLEAAEKLSVDPNLKIESLVEGNALLLKTTQEVFNKLQIEEINPIEENFDPDFHQAMATQESDNPNNSVLEVMQKGYKLKSKLLRPALVIVAKKK